MLIKSLVTFPFPFLRTNFLFYFSFQIDELASSLVLERLLKSVQFFHYFSLFCHLKMVLFNYLFDKTPPHFEIFDLSQFKDNFLSSYSSLADQFDWYDSSTFLRFSNLNLSVLFRWHLYVFSSFILKNWKCVRNHQRHSLSYLAVF